MFQKQTLPLVIAFGLLIAGSCSAQHLSLPTDGVFASGRYVPLSIDIDAPGEIYIRGDDVQGVDLPAAGRGSVIVPLMIWRTSAGPIDLHINGQSQRLNIQPLGDGDPLPPALAAFRAAVDPDHSVGPQSAAIDASAYENLDLWNPGRSEKVRQFIFRSAIVVALVLGAAFHLRRKPSPWLVGIVAVVLIGGIVIAVPKDVARVGIPVTDQAPRITADAPIDATAALSWVWRVSSQPQTIVEPFKRSLWFVPRSVEDLAKTQPVLQCNAQGQPIAIRMMLGENGRAAFIRRR